MSTAAVVVDCGVVTRIGVDESDFGAKLFEDGFIDDTSGTVGAVHGEVETIEIGIADVFEKMGDVEFEGFVVEIFPDSSGCERVGWS